MTSTANNGMEVEIQPDHVSGNPTSSNNISQDVSDTVNIGMSDMPIFRKEDFEYDMSKMKYLVIFNHYKFEATPAYGFVECNTRCGTQIDVDALTTTFKKLKFEVTVHNDLDCSAILDEVKTISTQDHRRTSCLAIAILTHGSRGGRLCAKDSPYQLKEISSLLENGNEFLVNKPKLLFIQACRGDKTDPGRTVKYDSADDNIITVPITSDFLYLFSTVEEYISYRDRTLGSWMIQEFCNALHNYAHEMDLIHIITITIKNVAYNCGKYYEEDKSIGKINQSPEARFTLTKQVKFY